jgi:hypothetical protein
MTAEGPPSTSAVPDVHSMTPEQATARLEEKAAQYRAAQGANQIRGGAADMPPAMGTPASATEARARLTALKNDGAWRDKLLAGSGPQLREFQELTALVAQGDFASDGMEVVDSVSNSHALRRSGYEAGIAALRDQSGLPAESEAMIRAFDFAAEHGMVNDLAPTEGDGIYAKQVLDRYLKSPEMRDKFLNGDPEVSRRVHGLNRLRALALQDGKPVTKDVIEILRKDGLR